MWFMWYMGYMVYIRCCGVMCVWAYKVGGCGIYVCACYFLPT